MNKSLDKWQENLKAIGCIEWTIGTDVYSYLKKSIFRWFDRIDYEDHIVYKDYEKDNENKKKIYFITKPDIVFYDSSKLYQSYSTIRQLLDVLNSLSILEKKDDKVYINKKLFFTKYNEYNAEEILSRFIIENLETSLNKFIIEKFENISLDNEWNNEDMNLTKFWWNLLRELDSTKVLEGKLKGFFPFLEYSKKNIYFKTFVNEMIINPINRNDDLKDEITKVFKNFVAKVQKITNLYNTKWKNYTLFPIDFENLNFNNYDRENLLDKKIVDNSENNNFFVMKANLLDIFTSKKLKYNLPLFQRTYSWDSNIIIGLFETIFSDYKKSIYYENYTLLNNIILGEYNSEQIIIDGQQRITSAILILISLFRLANYKEDEETINILKYPMKKIESMISKFANSDKNYLVLKYIYNGDIISIRSFAESMEESFNIIKQTRFIKNSNEIYNLLTKKFLQNNESLYEFVKYLLNNSFLIVTYICQLDTSQKVTKIFQNINQYSKKLGVLDLVRNKIYEKYSNENNIHEIIKIFNETINLFFRKNLKADKDEDLKLLINFLDNILIKNEKISEIASINDDYYDSISNAFEKFNLLVSIYDKRKTQENILFSLWKDLLEYEYANTGYINTLLEILDNKKLLDENLIKITEMFKNKIDDYKTINFQIFHISNGGNKTVFIPLILALMKRLSLFQTPNELVEQQMITFSKYLAYIERFSALWKIKFSGDSLSNSIKIIIKKYFIDSERIIEPKELYIKLEETIKEIEIMSSGQKVTELYKNLKTHLLDLKIKDNNAIMKSNLLYKSILGKVFNSLKFKVVSNPMFFGGYSFAENKTETSNFLNYTLDFSLSQRLSKEEQTKLHKIGISDDELQSVVRQIGNTCLLSDYDNIKIGYKKSKDYDKVNIKNNTVREIKDSTFKYIDFKSTKNKIIFSNEFISIPEIIPFSVESYEDFLRFKEHISARSESIIKAYVSILFYDFLED